MTIPEYKSDFFFESVVYWLERKTGKELKLFQDSHPDIDGDKRYKILNSAFRRFVNASYTEDEVLKVVDQIIEENNLDLAN